MTESDFAFMREAIELSKRGFPAPNPRVGCVVVLDGKVVGTGFHEAAGLDHAEVIALNEAGAHARAATLFVTLEPCSHHGKTPPCVDAIVAAGIRRVVYAVKDPNQDAAGGASRLQSQSVLVEEGMLKDEATNVNRVFLTRYERGRPFVLAKAATTLDGRIATRSGESKWITGDQARERAHELRAEMGCVLVGANTVINDDPALTVRDVDAKSQPVRVVLDPEGITPEHARVFTTDPERTVWVTESEEERNVATIRPQRIHEEISLQGLLTQLASRGVIGVLVEGGGQTLEPFFRQGLVDEIELHVAPKLLGAGRSWLDGRGVEALADAWRLKDMKVEPLGDDFKVTARIMR